MIALDHTAPHVPPQGLSFPSEKRVGHRQLPDLGVQFLHLLLVDPGLLAVAARRQGTFPLTDHRWMNPEPTRQFDGGLLALPGGAGIPTDVVTSNSKLTFVSAV